MKAGYETLIADWDDTLFDTARFLADIETIFLGRGIDKKRFEETYAVAKRGNRYSFAKHAEVFTKLGIAFPDNLRIDLENLISSKYLFPDSLVFLNFAKDFFSRRILLTLGDEEFQMKKIGASGTESFFSEIRIVSPDKKEYLKTLNLKKAVFINDNLKENIELTAEFPDMEIISKINTRKFSLREYRQSLIPCFRTLDEIKSHLQSKKNHQ